MTHRSPAQLLLLVLLLPLFACGPAKRPENAEERTFPAYSPSEANLYDDSFSERALSPGQWAPDVRFRDRVRRADSVLPARIATVTEQPNSFGAPTFVVELRPLGQPLLGREERALVRLELAPDNPAYRLFRWQRQQLLGVDVVLVYKRYLEDGVVKVHFRAEPNTAEVHYAVMSAAQGT